MERKKIKKLSLKTRLKIVTFLEGSHKSIFKGEGIEFLNIRKYVEGDNYRNIDWKTTARLGVHNLDFPFFVKEYKRGGNIRIYFAIDFSGSMTFGNKISKKDFAKYLIEDLVYSLKDSQDDVGLFIFTDRINKALKARNNKKHVKKLLKIVNNFSPDSKKSRIATVLNSIYLRLKKKCVLFIISDFHNYESFIEILKKLEKKHDLIAIKIYDPSEYNIPNLGLVKFEDLETEELLFIDTSDEYEREKYHRMIMIRREQFNNLLKEYGIGLIELNTKEDYRPTLINFFMNRSRKV